jgi:BirA family transcriptional regulator, biotin operon repressor / biotin---[acetyl-CoA-carboxylase] ligase
VSAIDLERVRTQLVAGEVTWDLHYEPSCSSTQDLARAASTRGAEQGWTIVTDLQLEGRGRQGRSWVAPPETALLFSIILRPPRDVLPLLPLLAALTVAGGIEASTGAVPDLKWPNDVLLNGKKLAGILLERPAGADVVLGVGLNVNQSRADLPDGATSLASEIGRELEREPLLAAILNDLGNAYERADREGVGWIVPGWRSRSSMLGDAVAFHRDGALIRGIAEDLTEDGALRIRLDDGSRISVVAGEVERVRTPYS